MKIYKPRHQKPARPICRTRHLLVGSVAAGAISAAMVAGWAWATMPLWLRVCSGIAGAGVLAAQYIWTEVERYEAHKAKHLARRDGRHRI